jgi:uncharacterized protein (DUF1810 family)
MRVIAASYVAAVRAQVDGGKRLEAIFGALDAIKFRSSMGILAP